MTYFYVHAVHRGVGASTRPAVRWPPRAYSTFVYRDVAMTLSAFKGGWASAELSFSSTPPAQHHATMVADLERGGGRPHANSWMLGCAGIRGPSPPHPHLPSHP